VEGRPTEEDVALERARRFTRNRLGAAVADKASDSFCAAVAAAAAPQAHAMTAFSLLESAAPAAAAPGRAEVAAIVELAAPATPAAPLPDRISPKAAEAVRAALEGVAVGVPAAEKSLAVLLRQAGVKAARDDFYRSLGPIRDAIEHGAAAVAGQSASARSDRIGITAAPVQACWLNRTVRASSDPVMLGEVAADPAVVHLDLPRRLVLDAVEIDVLIAAAAAVREGGGPTGAGVTVGVLDQEVADGHPALRDRVIHRRNYTQEPFGTPGPHGTAVAGIIAAASDEYSGVAPAATIANYKVAARVDSLNGTDFEGALAIQHALEDGVHVVNCSWGHGPATDGTSREARACDEAWGLGLTIVKSAGNGGPHAGTLSTPADAEGVIVVGGTDQPGKQIGPYSSRGPTGDGRHRPHLLAPGGLEKHPLTGLAVGGGVATVGYGTSFAAPHVAGLVALLLEQEPDLLPAQQRDRLIAACAQLAGQTEDAQGSGLIDPSALFGH
jgi:serine protease AprX